jgi:hypothetical protein
MSSDSHMRKDLGDHLESVVMELHLRPPLEPRSREIPQECHYYLKTQAQLCYCVTNT